MYKLTSSRCADSSFEEAVAASINASASNPTFDSRADDPSFLACEIFKSLV